MKSVTSEVSEKNGLGKTRRKINLFSLWLSAMAAGGSLLRGCTHSPWWGFLVSTWLGIKEFASDFTDQCGYCSTLERHLHAEIWLWMTPKLPKQVV